MVTSTEIGVLVLDVLAGVGVLLAGVGVLIGMLALAKTLSRVNVTLDGVDRQLENLGEPVAKTLGHVDAHRRHRRSNRRAARAASRSRSKTSPGAFRRPPSWQRTR